MDTVSDYYRLASEDSYYITICGQILKYYLLKLSYTNKYTYFNECRPSVI